MSMSLGRAMQTRALVPAIFVLALAAAPAAFAEDFHINDKADTLSAQDAQGYVGGSVAAVTNNLGSPSMVRFSQSDPNGKIDYIYIGNAYVYTFEAAKELGKQVVAYYRDGRSQWENGVYPGYPKKE